MPTLIIKTNADLAADDHPALLPNQLPSRLTTLLRAASATVAEMLGKPERYVMVLLEQNSAMCFGGDTAPLAYLELKSLDLPERRSAEFSATLCRFVQQHLGVAPERVYIEFASPPRHLFGFDGGTF